GSDHADQRNRVAEGEVEAARQKHYGLRHGEYGEIACLHRNIPEIAGREHPRLHQAESQERDHDGQRQAGGAHEIRKGTARGGGMRLCCQRAGHAVRLLRRSRSMASATISTAPSTSVWYLLFTWMRFIALATTARN